MCRVGEIEELREVRLRQIIPHRGIDTIMDKKVIQRLLVINSGDEAQRVRTNIVEALRLILEGIPSNQVGQEHAIQSVATFMGFLARTSRRLSVRQAVLSRGTSAERPR